MLNTTISHQPAYKKHRRVTQQAQPEKPVRLTKRDIEIVRSEIIGPHSDPDGNKMLLHIAGTLHYVSVYLAHVGMGKWFYDLKNARLATKRGRILSGKEGELPKEVKDLLYRVWGPKSLEQNLQHKTFG